MKIEINKDSKDSTSEERSMFGGKTFFSKHSIPINDENTVDSLLTKLIMHKKQGSREFTTASDYHQKSKHNHYIEVPMGSSFPTTRELSKCVHNMLSYGGDKRKRAIKVIDGLEK